MYNNNNRLCLNFFLKEILTMLKRIIAIAVAVLIVMSMAAIAVSAAEVTDSAVGADSSSSVGAGTTDSESGAGDLIYFDASGWTSFKKVFCHIWEVGGDTAFFGWKTPSEECQPVKGSKTKFSYDISKLKDSMDVSGGMKAGGKYCVAFVAENDVQTYDTTIGTECIGDTAYITDNLLENPMVSEKKGNECKWENDGGKYGPHKVLTSVGHVVGEKYAPGETDHQVIGDWACTYFNSTSVKAVDALAKAYPQFSVKTIDDLTDVYAYVLKKSKDGKVDKNSLPKIKKTLEDAFYKAYPSQQGQEIDEDDAQQQADSGQAGNSGSLTGGSSNGNNSNEGSSYGGSDYSGDYSGSGADGQETTIFFVLGGVMIAAAGAMFISRKKREE